MAAPTLSAYPMCADHQLVAYPNRPAAEQELVRRRTRATLSSTREPRLAVRRCRSTGRPNTWHVQRVHGDPARAAAQQLVDDLKALDPSVDAGIVPGTPSCADACEHKRGCYAVAAVTVTTTDSLTGDRVQTQYCYGHVRSWVRWLLECPHRRDHDEPPVIDVEVQVVPV